MIKIVLPGCPLSTNHIYKMASKPFPRMYLSTIGKQIKQKYLESVYQQFKMNPISFLIKIKIDLYFNDLRKRDWDNYHKLTMDSFNGIVWEDDHLVKVAVVEKHYDKRNPRIEIEIDEYVENA